MKMLNIACGSRYHKDWINIDFYPQENVSKANILKGLPFDNDSFDVVYSSHFLEHLTPEQADFVLSEIYRILKPSGGIIRVVVPDLENICKEYLKILDLVRKDSQYDEFYEWIVIELIDQLVRCKSGGKMLENFSKVKENENKKLAEYIAKRTGDNLFVDKRKKINKKITIYKIKNKILSIYLALIRHLIPTSIRDLVFIKTSIGERHRWMYDSYSLSKKLYSIGFQGMKIKKYDESGIPNFNMFLLDISEDGSPYKGESSIYIEAKK